MLFFAEGTERKCHVPHVYLRYLGLSSSCSPLDTETPSRPQGVNESYLPYSSMRGLATDRVNRLAGRREATAQSFPSFVQPLSPKRSAPGISASGRAVSQDFGECTERDARVGPGHRARESTRKAGSSTLLLPLSGRAQAVLLRRCSSSTTTFPVPRLSPHPPLKVWRVKTTKYRYSQAG